MQRNSEKAVKNSTFVEVSRCRYLHRRSLEQTSCKMLGNSLGGAVAILTVLYTEDWVCHIALIECTLSLGKTQEGSGFRREGYKGPMGKRGVSLRATWD